MEPDAKDGKRTETIRVNGIVIDRPTVTTVARQQLDNYMFCHSRIGLVLSIAERHMSHGPASRAVLTQDVQVVAD